MAEHAEMYGDRVNKHAFSNWTHAVLLFQAEMLKIKNTAFNLLLFHPSKQSGQKTGVCRVSLDPEAWAFGQGLEAMAKGTTVPSRDPTDVGLRRPEA